MAAPPRLPASPTHVVIRSVDAWHEDQKLLTGKLAHFSLFREA